MSKLKFYSMGIVAENKELNSDIVEISPVEELLLLDGEITSHADEVEASNINKDGQSSTASTKITNTIPATWLPIAGGNRVTSPDVRRGAVVMLYRMADEDKYYWTTLTNDLKLRKLETVLYAFSATTDEAAEINGDNYYYLEVSTHTKTVTFHTSKVNGEPYTYDIQINTNEGKIVITDDIGNYIMLDSARKQIRLENTSGTFLEIIDKDGNFNIPGNFTTTVGGNCSQTVGGSKTESVSGSKSIAVSGSRSLTVGGGNSESVGGGSSSSVSGSISSSASSHTFNGPVNAPDNITSPRFRGTADAALSCP